MMYRKAIVFQDNETAEQIMQESQPRRHKSLGRNVKNFDTGQWNKCKEEVVEEGNWWKFTRTERDEDLKKRLLETGNRLLVEVGGWLIAFVILTWSLILLLVRLPLSTGSGVSGTKLRMRKEISLTGVRICWANR